MALNATGWVPDRESCGFLLRPVHSVHTGAVRGLRGGPDTSGDGERVRLSLLYHRGMDFSERWHGTAGGYSNHDCKCDDCRAAWRVSQKAARDRRKRGGLPDGDKRHGTNNGYINYGCKCDACTEAHRLVGKKVTTA